MPQLYHNDIYKFEKPIKSYWEETCVNLKKAFKTINSDFNTNIVIIGAGYTGLS